MDRHTKSFIVASLLYFVAAALLGIWMGSGEPPSWALFAHVHFNLLGFMAMMVYGVGYFVIPRFNARELRWPSWVPLHFWVANVGLVGLVATYSQIPSTWFTVFAVLSALSVVLFAVNLVGTILLPEQQTAAPTAAARSSAQAPAPEAAELAQMRVGGIITRWPQTVPALIEGGLAALADEAHREQVRDLPVTLAMACSRHQLDLATVSQRLREVIGGQGQRALIGPDDVLGDILAKYPEADPVLRKYYGSGCFTCPGQATETVTQSAMMHNVDREALLRELNQAALAAGRGAGAATR